MVCLGNICRSPLAEGIMRQLSAEQDLDWEVASAGTGDWHTGQPADRRSIAVAKRFGYEISQQRARHFKRKMFDDYDCILVMDRNNLRDVLSLAERPAERKKVRLFLEDDLEVQDPYYDDGLFEPVLLEIEQRCRVLIEELR